MSTVITVLSGTNRKGSNTLKVAKLAQKRLEEKGVTVQLVDLQDLPRDLFVPEHYFNPPPSFAPFQKAILETQGLLVVTPEYNGSFPGVLKYFIDLLKFPDSLKEMKTAFVGVAQGQFGAIRSIEQLTAIFQYREAHVYGKRALFMDVDHKLSPDGREITHEFTKKKFEAEIDGFVEFVKRGA